MLKKSATALEKWKGFDEAIDRWLEERHHLILHLSRFADNHDFEESNPQVEETLQAFTALLIDYVSAGHFEFYHRLIKEGREFGDLKAVVDAAPLLKAIEASTEEALRFNEKYDNSPDLTECASDLSTLAEAMAVRFDAEDELIENLHYAHTGEMGVG